MKTILKFESKECPQCKFLSLTLMKAEKDELKGKVTIKNIDIEDENNQDLVNKYKVRSLPTMVFLDENNEEYDRMMGNRPLPEILKLL